jgi:hypothetical protein
VCKVCGKILSAAECKWCIRNEKEPTHAQCITPDYKDDPLLTIRKSEYDRLDLCRLAFIVNPDLSSGVDVENARLAGIQLFGTLNLEEKQVQIAKITEVLYAIQELSQKDPKYRKGMLQERDRRIAQEQSKVKANKIKEEQPRTTQPKPALIDVTLDEFAKKWQYKDINEAKTQLTLYKNTVKQLAPSLGIDIAIQFAETAQQERLKKLG